MPEFEGDERRFLRSRGGGHVAEELAEHVEVLFGGGVADAVDDHEFRELADLEDGADGLLREGDALVLHEGGQRVDVAGVDVVGDDGTLAGFDLDEAPVLELVEAAVDDRTGDVHLLREFAFGGEDLTDFELAGDDGILNGLDEKIPKGRGRQLFKFHKNRCSFLTK